MAWVKRNLIFVIIIAVGLLGTGYCGYLVYGALGANASASSDYSSVLEQLQTEEKATPPATPANIEEAKADQERVRQFLADFRKSFAPFPTAQTVDERGFADHLQLVIRQFAQEATNDGVQYPPDYAFSFSQEKQKVSFPPDCIATWMQEIEDMRLILRILFNCKINYFESIHRVPACDDDNSGDDTIQATVRSNAWGIVTPYQVAFRGFSTEVASVLTAFADSSNCFIVKYVNITPSKAALPDATVASPTMQQTRYAAPAQDYNSSYGIDDGSGRGRYRGRGMPRPQAQEVIVAQPTGPAPPETILQETPLYVTIVVDAVNLKQPESAKANAAPAARKRPER